MSIPGSAESLLLAQQDTGYRVERSLRFNSSDSAFCSRTFTSSGNRKKWTWAGWVKRSSLGSVQRIFAGWDGGTSDDNYTALLFFSDETIRVGGYSVFFRTSNAVFRDTSAWMHITFTADLDNANNALKFRVWVNNVELSWTGTGSNPSTTGINAAVLHGLGGEASAGGGSFCNLYLADVYFIDGQALDPSSFVETSATTGQLIPKQYTGSFGTNGFWLKFSDNSAATATTLGKDYSGNSNNWTPNNLSVTAGAGNDSLTDTPTSYGTDTGAGGEVRGNYCTWNPLSVLTATANSLGLYNGNLYSESIITWATFAIPSSGKWYWEMTFTGSGSSGVVGIAEFDATYTDYFTSGNAVRGIGYMGNGQKVINGTNTSYNAAYGNDTIGVAVNMDANSITFYKNGVSQGSISNISSYFTRPFFPSTGSYTWSKSPGGDANFGQRQWAYAAPAGFKALCDQNLPAPVVAKPSTVMDVVTRTFTGASATVSSLAFSPDLLWFKRRDDAASHSLFDSVRGVDKRLLSNGTNGEITVTDALTSFNSNGFTLGADSGSISVNGPSGGSGVVWAFDAGTTTTTNTQGSITSSCRTNQSSGFSVITYSGNGSTGSVGHGLNVAPQFVIYKIRNGSSSWQVYHASLGATKYLNLDTTDAVQTSNTRWNDTAPSSTVVSLGTNGANSFDYVMYAWAPVSGYSSFGSYVGTGAVSTGPFCYTGFRPRLVILKAAVGGTSGWIMVDTARNTYNAVDYFLQANSSGAESTQVILDAVSNGFVIRPVGDAMNNSGVTFVWAAFAESPFQYARAR